MKMKKSVICIFSLMFLFSCQNEDNFLDNRIENYDLSLKL